MCWKKVDSISIWKNDYIAKYQINHLLSNGSKFLAFFFFALFVVVVVDVIVYIPQSIQIEILKVSFYYAIIVIYKTLTAPGMK